MLHSYNLQAHLDLQTMYNVIYLGTMIFATGLDVCLDIRQPMIDIFLIFPEVKF